MGRRDAVQVTLEVINRMRQLEPRLRVTYEPGWETRGNGTSANFEGGIVHHTASASSLARPFPTQNILRDGRPDLSGPLCNESAPACTVEAPWIHVIAANPANHAGASGGKSMGPLPVTSLFNPRVRGLEIDYAGTVPMLAGQLYVAHLWARANADVVGGGNIERIRAHFETSITGKWDIGYAPGKSYDMAAFRRDAAALIGDDMPSAQEIVQALLNHPAYDGGASVSQVLKDLHERTGPIRRPDASGVLRSNPMLQELADINTRAMDLQKKLADLAAGGVGTEALLELVKASVKAGLAGGVDVRATVSVGDQPAKS